ncbi:hypothetical protein NPIL_358871, partial [Nephila pilipes]
VFFDTYCYACLAWRPVNDLPPVGPEGTFRRRSAGNPEHIAFQKVGTTDGLQGTPSAEKTSAFLPDGTNTRPNE